MPADPQPYRFPATLDPAAGTEATLGRPNSAVVDVAAGPAEVIAVAPARGLTRRWTPRGEAAGEGDLVARVLAARGLGDPEEAREFLNPSLRHLHDPSLIPDLDRAAERLLAAVRAGERVVIYGDYDTDGITATAILYHMLRAVAPDAGARQIGTYVPHRLEEGYGLNTEALREIAASGARVVVSVDCGITAIEPARAARELGLDLIITDHHNPPRSEADLPEAYAVVHPRRPASRYPFGELCGAGVAYKLAWRIATAACGSERVRADLRDLLVELLAFCSLGTIADVVPLVGENRVIARFGLNRIKTTPFEGLRTLVVAAGLGGERVKADDVGFRLAPRLNASGRLGHAKDAVELFTTARGERAIEIATKLSALNDDRREVERAIYEEACAAAEAAGMTGAGRRAIVLAGEAWHPGGVGIVCSRLAEKYCRPAILLHRRVDEDGSVRLGGSGRSVDGFSLHAALEACGDLLTGFGGHDMAAGLRLDGDRFEEFVDAFTRIANDCIAPGDLVPSASYDAEATLGELRVDVVRDLQNLAPFGRDHPPVAVRLRGLRVIGRPEAFGKRGEHLALRVREDGHPLGPAGPAARIVGWRWAERTESIPPGAKVQAIVRPGLSTFGGRASVEPELVDLMVEPG